MRKRAIQNRYYVCIWYDLILPVYFTIQLIFTTIYGFHCTFFVLFMSLTVLFQVTFTFIYSTFSKKILVLAK